MLNIIRSKILHLVVFTTGGCLLVLEVLATRLLSPYFGNTIFTVSSVIGVVLAALSVGYYYGGIIADKNPNLRKFYLIIFTSGLATFLLKILSSYLLPYLGHKYPITYGPLISSFLLFALPSFLLGLLSPYAIALENSIKKNAGIGKTSGEIFFASTLGSIAGTFLAGFYLIPNFGLSRIIFYVALTLSIIGFVGVLTSSVKKNFKNEKLVFIFAVFAFGSLFSEDVFKSNSVYSKDGLYEKITVIDTLYKEKPARVLLLDRSFASALYHNERENLIFEYTKYVDLYRITNINPKKALVIGGGAYSLPNYLIRNYSDVIVDIAEIEPELYEVSKKYFWFSDNSRLYNHVTDGRRFLHDTSNLYDIIFSDVYSSVYSIPIHFTTKEFFQLAKDKLTENGMFMANIIGDLATEGKSLTFSEIKTFKSVFPNSYFFAVESPGRKTTQNLIFLGLKSGEKLNFTEIAEKYKDVEILTYLENKRIDENSYDYNSYSLLTDDYAPIEDIAKYQIERDLSQGK